MAKRPVKTIHLLDIAESLKAQNEALSMLIAKCEAVGRSAGSVGHEDLIEQVKMLATEAERTRALLWPQEERE